MYYEEKFIDGKLMFRTMPDGYWMEKTTAVSIVANQVLRLNEEERQELFGLFCIHCGSSDPTCWCWRDE